MSPPWCAAVNPWRPQPMRRCKEQTNISQPQGMPVPDQIVNFKTKVPLEHQRANSPARHTVPHAFLPGASVAFPATLTFGKNSVPFFPIFPLHAAEMTMRDLMEAEVTRRSSRAQQSGPVTVDRTKPRRLLFSSRASPASPRACGTKQARSVMQFVHITASRRRKVGRCPFVAQVFDAGNEVVEARPLFAMLRLAT